MDMKEFKEEFIKEAKEHLTSVEEGLKKLGTEYNKDLLVEIKRGFHTLKGNAGAMGYQKFFDLSKALNDLTQKMIDDEAELKEEEISLLKDGKDKLLYALDYINNEEPDNFDDGGMVDKIRKMIDT